jgi:hypothetical protein
MATVDHHGFDERVRGVEGVDAPAIMARGEQERRAAYMGEG